MLGIVDRKQDGRGHGHRKHQTQHRRDGQHHAQGTEHGDHAGTDLHKIRGKRGIDGVHVVGNAADDIAHLRPVEVAYPHLHQFGEDILPHLADDGAGQIDHNHLKQVRQHAGQHIKHRHQTAVVEHLPERDGALSEFDGIDGHAGQLGTDQRKQIGCDSQSECQQNDPFILIQIHAQAQKNPQFLPAAGVARIGDFDTAGHTK